MSVTPAAMYIDFDNFFGGLIAADPDSAVEVATNPSTWLARLTHEHSGDGGRRWLALRCYMNPAGWVTNPRVETERLYFSKFRPYFVRAGFEVVDCPTLARGKNAADIRIGTPELKIGNPETGLGILAAAGASWTPARSFCRRRKTRPASPIRKRSPSSAGRAASRARSRPCALPAK